LTGGAAASKIEAVRVSLLIARVALSGVLVALVFASDGSAGGPKEVDVALTANGPSPSAVTKAPYDELVFVNHDSVAHTVVLVRSPYRTCSLDVAPGEITECHDGGPTSVGRYAYTVDGTLPGTVKVVAYRRSVSLTAQTQNVRLGSQLKLHGQLTYDNGSGGCGDAFPFVVRVLARHGHSQSFKRITMLPVGGLKDTQRERQDGLCSYSWHLNVRPGTTTSYIAESTLHANFWKQARSRVFTVRVHP
jgi:plastocyanin